MEYTNLARYDEGLRNLPVSAAVTRDDQVGHATAVLRGGGKLVGWIGLHYGDDAPFEECLRLDVIEEGVGELSHLLQPASDDGRFGV